MIPHDPTEHVEHMPAVGDLIGGRYRLESVIGHGALGTVMRAQHITMGREVAVKLLRPEISNHSAIRRRLIERVHQAQSLKHPNNCRLLDFGQAGGSLFIVMELLQGAPLQTIIERGAPYPVGWVLDIGMQILDGLGEAHDDNFVHRNLKPRNIYLLPRRRGGQQVKILDYGLASSLDSLPQNDHDEGDDDEDDREAQICGTAAYLAPETLLKQISGKSSDVYAIGLILVEMLTGKKVFSGDSLEQVLYRQIHTSVRLPPKLAWTSLGKVLMKAVSKHPDNRYQDADEFYEALEQASESTAAYFRLDPSDLEPDEEAMPPEMLARMLKRQRGRSGSDSDSSGDEDDPDEAEPGACARSCAGSGSRSDSEDATPTIPLTPPPIPLGGRGVKHDPPAPADYRFGRRGRCSNPASAPAMRVTHPLGEVDGDSAFPRASFPRIDRRDSSASDGGEDVPPTEHDGEQAPMLLRLAKRLEFDEAGWASRVPLLLAALAISLAGVGLYLTLS